MKKFSVDNVFLKVTTFLWIILILHTSLFLEIVTTKFGGERAESEKNKYCTAYTEYIYIF